MKNIDKILNLYDATIESELDIIAFERFLDKSVELNEVSITNLKQEIVNISCDINFDWRPFVSKYKNAYYGFIQFTHFEMIDYIKVIAEKYIREKEILTQAETYQLYSMILNILKLERDWIDSYSILDKIRCSREWSNLEYYDLLNCIRGSKYYHAPMPYIEATIVKNHVFKVRYNPLAKV